MAVVLWAQTTAPSSTAMPPVWFLDTPLLGGLSAIQKQAL